MTTICHYFNHMENNFKHYYTQYTQYWKQFRCLATHQHPKHIFKSIFKNIQSYAIENSFRSRWMRVSGAMNMSYRVHSKSNIHSISPFKIAINKQDIEISHKLGTNKKNWNQFKWTVAIEVNHVFHYHLCNFSTCDRHEQTKTTIICLILIFVTFYDCAIRMAIGT